MTLLFADIIIAAGFWDTAAIREKGNFTMKKILCLYIPIFCLTILLFLQISFYYTAVPDNFFREEEGKFALKAYPMITVKETGESVPTARTGGERTMTATLYGIIPIKNVTVTSTEAPRLIPSGEAFGLKMLTEGIYVTDYGYVDGVLGIRSPAKEAGLEIGDVIISANGKKLSSANELSDAVQADGKRTVLTVKRDGRDMTIEITPECSKADGLFKLGIWTRDSCAGIGTLTYYDEENCTFGGLGHSVCDVDTGTVLSLSKGETVPVRINRVVKGVDGSPGELCGSFMSASPSGSIALNTDCGVFGYYSGSPTGESIPVAFKQDIEVGAAQIITTIDGMTPQYFDIEIEKVNYNSDTAVKNMVIRITDEELLSKAGGIVQGMSGSPIIQNGKIAGAVTHVFVNDVSRGYAIFAENMYGVSSKLEKGEVSNLNAA